MSFISVNVRCVGCNKTRQIGAAEAEQLTKTRAVPTCQTCWLPMVADSARKSGQPS